MKLYVNILYLLYVNMYYYHFYYLYNFQFVNLIKVLSICYTLCTFIAGSFGRRASDGGANLHIFHQQHNSSNNSDEECGWSQPGSREQLQSVSIL